MRKKTLKIAFREMAAEVKSITTNETLSLPQRFSSAMPLVNSFLDLVHSEKTACRFSDKFEEIYFFKFEKPEYWSQKTFLSSWYALLMGRPSGTDEMVREYLLAELSVIARFFKQHAFHYEYYRSGFTELDESLFLRSAEVSLVHFPEQPELDPDFATAGDHLFARFIAYEALQEFILSEIAGLDRPGNPVALSIGAPAKQLSWTGEVINLVELGYGLYVSGQIGEGKTSLADIFRWLESSFGVKIGIPANRLREIKRRKRLSKLHFILLMQELLLEYIDQSEGIAGGKNKLN